MGAVRKLMFKMFMVNIMQQNLKAVKNFKGRNKSIKPSGKMLVS